MPNWCNNFITFWSDDTPEGDAALKDLHDKIEWTSELVNEWRKGDLFNKTPNCYSSYETWEVYLAKYAYGIDIDTYCRGYITYVEEYDENKSYFCIETEDAWSPNNGFWMTLLQYAYQGHIYFTFQASEPGMQIYETNDPAMLPRYTACISTDESELIKYDKCWDFSNPLFPYLIPNDYIHSPRIYTHNSRLDAYGPTLDVYEVEGDEDEILDMLSEYKTLSPDVTISDIKNENGFYCASWSYCDLEQCLISEKFNALTEQKFFPSNTSIETNYGTITIEGSNLFYYKGDNNNV